MSETTAGHIIGFLRLETRDWMESLDRAEAKAEGLGRKSPNVHIRSNAKQVTADVEGTQRAVDRLDRSSASAGRSSGALLTAVVALGPALVPLAAGAVGLGSAFIGMGAAGVLAFQGAKDQIDKGTEAGDRFQASLNTLSGGLQKIQQTAALGVLGGFEQVTRDIDARMPALNTQMGQFAAMLGNAAAPALRGLVDMWLQLQPVLDKSGTALVHLGQGMARVSQSQGFRDLVSYIAAALPQVLDTLGALVPALGRIVAAFAPLGSTVLSVITGISNVINGIPVPVLAALATTGVSVFLAFKTWSALSGILDGVKGKLIGTRLEAVATSGAMTGLAIAGGVVSAALGIAVLAWTAHQQSMQEARQAADNYTTALKETNGVINENVRAVAVKALSDSGALDAARSLGLSLADVTDAALGNTTALGKIDDALDKVSATASGDAYRSLKLVANSVNGQNEALNSGMQAWRDQRAAMDQTTSASAEVNARLGDSATAFHTTAEAIKAAEDAQNKQATAASAATLQMQLENNAAGLLKQSLDALSGKALSAAQAQSAFDQAIVAANQAAASGSASPAQRAAVANATDRLRVAEERLAEARVKGVKGARLDSLEASVASARRSLATANDAVAKASTHADQSLTGMSKAAVDNRARLLGLVSAAEQAAEAYGNQTGSSEKGRQKLVELRKELIDNAVAHGADRKAVEAYIDQVLKIPKSVPPTKLDVDTKAAEAKMALLRKFWADPVYVKILATANDTRGDAKRADIRNANGNVLRFASGTEDHRAFVASRGTPMRVFNEPETGGEAYIPLAASKRPRSLAITRQVAGEFGYELVPAGGQSAGTVEKSVTNNTPVIFPGQVYFGDVAESRAKAAEARRYKAMNDV